MLDRNDGLSGPRWRAILEARWRARLAELTELSLAYHAAAADGSARLDRATDKRARQLLRRAVAARQRLADTEDALDRVAAGDFGRCEECGVPIAETLLSAAPEARYCTGCAGIARLGAPARPVPSRRAVPVARRAVPDARGAVPDARGAVPDARGAVPPRRTVPAARSRTGFVPAPRAATGIS